MRLGIAILPDRRWTDAAPRWRAAEQLGAAHLWTYDHLAWRDLRDGPWFSAMPLLTAAAAVTDHALLGTLVASPNFRHPVPFAREVLTLDDISGGRFVAGLGAGGTGWDAAMLGGEPWSSTERAERFEEFVALLDRLLRERDVSWAGRHYAAVEARSAPGCVQQPRVPFAIAGRGPRAMAVVAAHGDWWVTTGPAGGEGLDAAAGAAVVGRQLERLRDACGTLGRDPTEVRVLVLTGVPLDPGLDSVEQFADTVGQYGDAGVTDLVVHWPRPAPPYEGDEARFAQVVGEVAAGLRE